LLKDQFDDKERLIKFSEIINQRSIDLLEIINDILDISKIESGQLPVNEEVCNLVFLFDDLTSFFTEYKQRIGKKQIKLSLHADCDPSNNIIITDIVKLKQIFINLINNAFKYTDEGKIEGGCKVDENNNLIFYVSDTGVGIPFDKQNLVFERFVQLNQASKKNIGGTGLGLSIVKGLVSILGGEISLKSEPGKGSTFSFTIPYKTTQHLFSEPSAFVMSTNKSLSDKTILIVEDDFYNTEYLKEILLDTGSIILHAGNGLEALEISINQPVDIVLMDIRLPDINGYDVTRQIRLHKPNLKIIAQTAYASQGEKEKAIDAGCNDYISKPTKKDMLLSMINRHLDK
jgi:CheY-like chemotaxis protein